MSEYVATENEGMRPVIGEPDNAGDAPAETKAMQPAQNVRQLLQQSPACERRP